MFGLKLQIVAEMSVTSGAKPHRAWVGKGGHTAPMLELQDLGALVLQKDRRMNVNG